MACEEVWPATFSDRVADTLLRAWEGTQWTAHTADALTLAARGSVLGHHFVVAYAVARVTDTSAPTLGVLARHTFAQHGVCAHASLAETGQSVEIAWGIVGDQTVGAGSVGRVAAVSGTLVAVIAVLGDLAFGNAAVTAAVFRARTAEQVLEVDDGALILFVGCEVARRHARTSFAYSEPTAARCSILDCRVLAFGRVAPIVGAVVAVVTVVGALAFDDALASNADPAPTSA
jgi:hypothetical protein